MCWTMCWIYVWNVLKAFNLRILEVLIKKLLNFCKDVLTTADKNNNQNIQRPKLYCQHIQHFP